MSKLKIKTKERRFETARDLYGIFFEDINRAGDGGLYPGNASKQKLRRFRFTGGLYTAGGWHPCKNRIRMAG